MSNYRKESSFEWVKYKPGNVWDNWKEYYTYRFAESIVDALDEAAEEKKRKRVKAEIDPDESSDKRSQWIAVIVIWFIAFVVIAIRFSL